MEREIQQIKGGWVTQKIISYLSRLQPKEQEIDGEKITQIDEHVGKIIQKNHTTLIEHIANIMLNIFPHVLKQPSYSENTLTFIVANSKKIEELEEFSDNAKIFIQNNEEKFCIEGDFLELSRSCFSKLDQLKNNEIKSATLLSKIFYASELILLKPVLKELNAFVLQLEESLSNTKTQSSKFWATASEKTPLIKPEAQIMQAHEQTKIEEQEDNCFNFCCQEQGFKNTY